MLIRSNLYRRIDEIVDLAYLGFMYDLIGDDLMTEAQKRQVETMGLVIGRRPLIELLYMIIRMKPRLVEDEFKLQDLLDKVTLTGRLPVFTDTQAATLENAKLAFMDTIESTKAELKKKVRQEISEVNKKYKQEVAVKRYSTAPVEEQKKIDYAQMLLAAMIPIAAVIQSNFNKAFTTNLTDMINDSVIDVSTEEAMFTGLDPSKTVVFKKVVNDGSLCSWCAKFYGVGEPKLYTLAELQANGSNYGKPKSQWKPVVGATHPRCRCELHVKR